jgi:thioredoxin-dependent peroxiredoxin
MERKGIVTVKGNPVTLIGAEIKVGDKAPDFTVVDGNLKEVRLRDFGGKTKVISVSASLDTPVCDMQARRFNREAALLPQDVVILNITMDLPFAISRFCTTAGIDKVHAFSDHRDASFGNAYGVLIKELRLLARSILIIDKDDVVRYIEIVPELTNHPDYDKAISSLKKLL